MTTLSLPNGETLRLIEGSIVKHKADVIVNSVNLSLDLKSVGPLSQAVLEAAGDGLQQECTAKYPGGFKEGEVAVTGAHNLPHKAVYHVYCPHYSSLGMQPLQENIRLCLAQADRDGHVSLAFPALGCGGRSYPVDQAARAVLETVVNYFNRNKSNVHTVEIVIPGTALKKEFQDVIEELKRGSLPIPASMTVVSTNASLERTFSIDIAIRTRKMSIIDLEGVDIFVNSTRQDLDLKNAGTLSWALSTAAGDSLQEECDENYPHGIKTYEIAVTGGHNLPCHSVYHVCCMRWDGGKGDAEKHLQDTIRRCWDKAILDGAESIAFPALGGKGLDFPADVVAKTMVHTLWDLRSAATPDTSLTEVIIVIHPRDGKLIKAFNYYTLGVKAPQKIPLQGGFTVELVIGSVAFHEADVVVNTASLSLDPADSSAYCKAVFKKAGPCLNEECQKRYPDGIREDKVFVTRGHGMDCDYIYHVYCPPRDKDPVLKEIGVIVVKCLKRAGAHGVESIAFPAIGTGGGGYPKKEVAKTMLHAIKAFYNKKKPQRPEVVQILLYDQDTETIKAFDETFSEEAKKCAGPTLAPLMPRKIASTAVRPETPIISTIKAPKAWTKLTSPLDLVEITSGTEEYDDIEKDFLSSNPEDCNSVIAIFRIQNRLLFAKYSCHKQRFVERNRRHTNFEQHLWHGTSKDTTPKINKNGFNRRYCGKNATAYGEGVYFATSSRYSAQRTYSTPDEAGIRYMYRARVCVGEYTQGGMGMKMPPPRKDDPDETFDSLVDRFYKPSIFVIFHDDQAYPEHLIYF